MKTLCKTNENKFYKTKFCRTKFRKFLRIIFLKTNQNKFYEKTFRKTNFRKFFWKTFVKQSKTVLTFENIRNHKRKIEDKRLSQKRAESPLVSIAPSTPLSSSASPLHSSPSQHRPYHSLLVIIALDSLSLFSLSQTTLSLLVSITHHYPLSQHRLYLLSSSSESPVLLSSSSASPVTPENHTCHLLTPQYRPILHFLCSRLNFIQNIFRFIAIRITVEILQKMSNHLFP